eukprot:CAMPEP_0194133542 /NCGR_PEP_ID=MMETSP0152-20130528/3668_1 /TAXON_ID=1049557 /ORGANISM="Thalassiothrix antarctica, Strain L6-D1" /LENGTH=802 /DNA_ID=CAMNT_0038828869 /DNA_START=210 /DNA_END=2618 /DNA_ORIENTATION=-
MSGLRRPIPEQGGNAFSNPTQTRIPRTAPKSPYNSSGLPPSLNRLSKLATSPSSEERQGKEYTAALRKSGYKAPGNIRVETITVASAESGERSETMNNVPSPATRRFQAATVEGIEKSRRMAKAAAAKSPGGGLYGGLELEGRDESPAKDIGGKNSFPHSIGGSTITSVGLNRMHGGPPKYPHYAPRDPNIYTPTNENNGDNRSVSSNSSQASRRSLDLMHNDNAFHVIANLLVERLAKCVKKYGDTALTLDVQDVANLDKMVPMPVRKSFIKALRYRLKKNCPPTSEQAIHILTRQCREFGLDREGPLNPLLGINKGHSLTVTNLPPITSIPRTVRASGSYGSRRSRQESNSNKPPLPPQSDTVMEVENKALRAQLEEQRKQLRVREQELMENASVASALTHPSVEHLSSTESLAKKQLMAELREASTLMAESQTPEASEFWKNHVLGLQSRLKVLHNQDNTRGVGNRSENSSQQSGSTPTSEQMKQWKHLSESGYAPPPYSNNMYSQPNKITTDIPDGVASPSQLTPQTPGERKFDSTPSHGGESNIGATRSTSPTKEMVSVVSPADLPGGYHFEAEIDGRRFLAIVPPNGAKKGQTFKCFMREIDTPGPTVPTGAWRDRICDCFRLGCMHVVLWNTLICPLLALGQIMTRMQLDVFGRKLKTRVDAWSTMWGIGTFWIAMNVFIYTGHHYKMVNQLYVTMPDYIAFSVLNATMLIYFIYAIAATRQAIRKKYLIRENRCYDLEDYCCATFCAPCSIGQMARHTAPYEDGLEAYACTRTGLDEEAVDLEYVNKLFSSTNE